MSILSCLDFISFLIYACLGIYILVKNPHAALNRIFFGITCCFAVWTFAQVFYDNPRLSEETLRLSVKIGSLGWLSFGSFVFPFFVFFTEKQHIIPLKKLLVLFIAVPSLLIYQQWRHEAIIADYIHRSYGWSFVWEQTIWTYLFFTYYSLASGIGLLLIVDYWKKTNNPEIKRQAAIIFITGMVALFAGSVTNVTLPALNIHDIPALGHLSLLLWVGGIAYVMVRYRFLTITPTTAAENILSTMTECLILVDPSGQIITVNKTAADILGYEKKKLEGRMFESLFDSKQEARELLKSVMSRQALSNKEFRFITSDDKKVPVILSARILKDEWGNITGVTCVARDITERIKMQEKIFALHKLESIRSLAGGIAHEYNNKLSVLTGNIDLIRLKIGGQGSVEKNLQNMQVAISQISELTAQLVAYARGGKYQSSPMGLADLVEKILPVFEHSVEGVMKIEKLLDRDVPDVIADFKQMEMVLLTILSNASEAIQDKGRIEISVSEVKISEEDIRLPAGFKPGHYACLRVKDDGKGMDEKTLKKVFDPFFSTKVQGRGLGMAAVYGIIKNHDGFIDVSSRLEQGTSVSIFLPVVKYDGKSRHDRPAQTGRINGSSHAVD